MTDETPPRAVRRTLLLLAIVAVAAAARLWNLGTGVPFAVGIDEPQVVDRALRILKTGDWNTHLFDYPTLAIYLHAIAAAARFLWGAVRGEWTSLDGFRIRAVYTTARLLTAATGVATVWLTYRLGARLGRRDVGLLAAAQMAVQPSHVRESHFALTDVPAAALTTAAVLLAVRAADRRTVRAYAAAGALSGLAAATKYIGGIALSALAVIWIVHERRAADRWRKALAAAGAAAAAFLAGAPYTVLDLPGFLDG
ncbi:MAG TPA: glycosyltransferase family 39 protein, partial [Vicinamibacterales bacterium]